MEPLTLAAIMAGSQLVGGALGSAAQRKQSLLEAQMGAQAQETKGLQESLAKQEQQQQGALANLIEAYRSSLLGG